MGIGPRIGMGPRCGDLGGQPTRCKCLSTLILIQGAHDGALQCPLIAGPFGSQSSFRHLPDELIIYYINDTIAELTSIAFQSEHVAMFLKREP
jgi:hypothetical protein